MEPVGRPAEAQFLGSGHKIADVTQLHSYYSRCDKLCLSLRQELSNSRVPDEEHFPITLRL